MRKTICTWLAFMLGACTSGEVDTRRSVKDDLSQFTFLMLKESQDLLSTCMRREGHIYTAVEPPKVSPTFVEPVASLLNLDDLRNFGYGATSSIEFALYNDQHNTNQQGFVNLSTAERSAYAKSQRRCIATLPRNAGASKDANQYRTDLEKLRNRWLNDPSLRQSWKSWSDCMIIHSVPSKRRDDSLVQIVVEQAKVDLQNAGLSDESVTQQHLLITRQTELRIAKVDSDCLQPIVATIGPHWAKLSKSLRRPS